MGRAKVMLTSLRQRVEELSNPVQEGQFSDRMRALYTMREAFESPSEAARAARHVKRRFGAVASVFERAGFWRVKVSA